MIKLPEGTNYDGLLNGTKEWASKLYGWKSVKKKKKLHMHPHQKHTQKYIKYF